jgi:quercetin dioxygenase-like cupin family protein
MLTCWPSCEASPLAWPRHRLDPELVGVEVRQRDKEIFVTYPAASPQPPRDALASTLKRTEIQHSPSSIPGREIVQVLTEIPAGAESGWHTHPGEEVGYIVAGTVDMAIRGRATLTLQAGDGFLIPPRTPHNARDIGPGTGHMLSTYIVEAGQPLASLTGEPDDR